MSNTLKAIALSALLIVVAACAFLRPSALAASGDSSNPGRYGIVEAYYPDRQAAAYRTSVSSADTADTETWGSVGSVSLNGRANVSVSCRFSGSSGDTATVLVAYYYQAIGESAVFTGSNSTTVAAGSLIDSNDDNVSDIVTFDARGATHVKVLLTSISAGNVDVWVGTY